MAKEFAKSFYKSKAWQDTRLAYCKKRKWLCEKCLSKGIIKYANTVHHTVTLTPENINDPEITLSFDKLELLCRDCHAEEHKKKIARRYEINSDGKVLTPPYLEKN